MLLLNKKGLSYLPDITELTSIGIKAIDGNGRTVEDLIQELTQSSLADIRRKIKAGSVWIGDEKADDPKEEISGNVWATIFIGKEMIGLVK